MDEFTGFGAPLSGAGFQAALEALGKPQAAALWAVLATETSGCGYLKDRRPKILFERHYFHRLTGGKFDAVDPDISAPTPGGYGAGGANQYVRLAAAIHLDPQAALASASWGIGQIMGANHDQADYKTVQAMVDDFVAGEDKQLKGMAAFIANSPMKKALLAKDWTTFARIYNGSAYAKNAYDQHLAAAFARFDTHGCPDLAVRAAQVWFSYLGVDTGGIDGIAGGKTTAAITGFQQAHGLAADGQPTDATLAALAQAAQAAPQGGPAPIH